MGRAPPTTGRVGVDRPVEMPKTTKGRETRLAIKRAAREVFGRDGYTNARVSDIAAAAGLSNGAFYRYFTDKRAVMFALIEDLYQEVYDHARAPWDPSEPLRSVYETTVRFFDFYREHADLYRLASEVIFVDVEVASRRRKAQRRFFARTARMLRRAQEEGIVRSDVDPDLAAEFLGAMTEHYADLWFITTNVPNRPIDEVSRTLVTLWASGILTQR